MQKKILKEEIPCLKFIEIEGNKELCVSCGKPANGRVWEIGDPQYLHEECETDFAKFLHDSFQTWCDLLQQDKDDHSYVEEFSTKYDDALGIARYLLDKYYSGFADKCLETFRTYMKRNAKKD